MQLSCYILKKGWNTKCHSSKYVCYSANSDKMSIVETQAGAKLFICVVYEAFYNLLSVMRRIFNFSWNLLALWKKEYFQYNKVSG